MSEAKTLLQMAGVKQAPANLSDAAVVIIDAQNEYVSGRLPLAGVNTALARLADLLAAARAAGVRPRGRLGHPAVLRRLRDGVVRPLSGRPPARRGAAAAGRPLTWSCAALPSRTRSPKRSG